jgi:hypothetical protein
MVDTPKAFWKMQEASGNPQDSSGNGLHIDTINGTPTYQQAGPMSDYGILCDAAEYLQRSTAVTTTNTNLTVELWIYVTDIAANGRGVVVPGLTAGWSVDIDIDRQFKFYNGTGNAADSAGSVALNGWTHMAVARDASSIAYYINGAVDTDPATPNSAVTAPSGITQINATNFMAARYAYVAIYESKLSAARVLAHYNAAFGQTLLPERLYGPAQLTASAADLYTCPASTVTRILHIHASNPSGSPVDINLSIGADAAATRIFDDYAVPADGVVRESYPYELAAGEKIQGWAASAGTVVLSITGIEYPA